MADKLKPCPFCGSNNVRSVVKDYLGYVKCLDCRAQGGHWQWHSATVCTDNRNEFDKFRAAFITSWNNRPKIKEEKILQHTTEQVQN